MRPVNRSVILSVAVRPVLLLPPAALAVRIGHINRHRFRWRVAAARAITLAKRTSSRAFPRRKCRLPCYSKSENKRTNDRSIDRSIARVRIFLCPGTRELPLQPQSHIFA
uniref:Putative secreted protein n=1 Tax=Anopheles marajoara TaxID=58244 RepID=A0A2M4C890_9DIPT